MVMRRGRDIAAAFRFGLLAGAAILPQQILAQSADQAEGEEAAAEYDNVIIVTARQRAERLQDVPATITAFTSKQIETANIERPQDFIALTPGVSQVQTVEVGDFQINIRGINSGRDTENSVALIIDGVLVTNPNALNQELDNVSQIEVLKGPQGALYGRNALAGAIIISTNAPTDTLQGKLEAGYGRYDLWNVSGRVSGPIGENISAAISAYHKEDDGSFFNSFRGCNDCENNLQETGATGRLRIEPSDKVEVDLKARYSRVRAGGVTFNASLALVDAANFLQIPEFWENPNEHDFLYINRNDTDNRQSSWNFSALTKVDLDFAELSLAGTYNDMKNAFISPGVSNAFGIYNANPVCQAEYDAAVDSVLNDPDSPYAVNPPFFYVPGNIGASFLPPYPPISCGGNQYQQRDQKDWSAEVRLTSTGDGPLDWMVGAYYANIKRHLVVAYSGDLVQGDLVFGFADSTTRNPTDLYYDDFLYSDVYAAFANAAYDISDGLELALALRYDVEERKVVNNVPRIAPQTPGFGAFGIPVCPDGPDNCDYYINPFYNVNPDIASIPSRTRSFDQLQPKATVNWEPGSDISFFASYGYGFRSGGFNSSGTAATLTQFFGNLALPDGTPNLNNLTDDFKKEVTKAAEIGFKATLMGGDLQLNGAAFRTIDKNRQDFSFFAGPFGSLRVVTNIDKAVLQGFEADFNWRVIPEFSLFGGFNYTDSEIKRYTTRPYTIGNKAPYVPEYSGNIGALVTLPVTDATDFVLRFDRSFVGKTWFSPVQDEVVNNFFTAFGFGRGDFSRQFRESYGTSNLTATIDGGSWKVTGWVTNLFDENYLAEIIPAPEFGGSFIHDSYGRTYGIKLGYEF